MQVGFICLIFVSFQEYFFANAQVVCPEAGLLNNFNQEVESATKCFFIAKNIPWSSSTDRFAEAESYCKLLGGDSAKLARPGSPMDNELARMVIEEHFPGNTKKILIGVQVATVEDGFKINFVAHARATQFTHSYPSNVDYLTRYETVVGEIGIINETGEYSYFLQEKTEDLATYIGKSGLCVMMNSAKGSWEIVFCENIDSSEKDILCQSDIFKNCKFVDTSCVYKQDYKACTKNVSQDCPPGIPVEVYCECDSQPCVYSTWSDWTSCVGDCSNRRKIRFKVSLYEKPECAPVFENETCNEPCSGCRVGQWSEWSSCNETCQNSTIHAYKNRTRTTDYHQDQTFSASQCKEMAIDIRICPDIPLCDLDCIQEIGNWSKCSATCGFGGKQTRSVTRIVDSTGNGLNCTEEPTERSCPNNPCPVDCIIYSPWETNSNCSATCYDKTLNQIRSVVVPENYNGTCSNNASQLIPCFVACATNCTLSKDYESSPCSVTCGQGILFKKRRVTVKESNWGFCDNPLENETCLPLECDPSLPIPIFEESLKKEKEDTEDRIISVYSISVVFAVIVLIVLIVGVIVFVKLVRVAAKKKAASSNQPNQDGSGTKATSKGSQKFTGNESHSQNSKSKSK